MHSPAGILANSHNSLYNNNMRLEEKIAQLLTENKKTLAVAESCTGGLLGHRVTNIPGSSEFFQLGLITYSNESKRQLLKIPSRILSRKGAVSEEVAVLMATRIRKLAQTDFGIGITGIAGPTGGTLKKPVGFTYIAVATGVETLCLKCLFKGNRLQIKTQAATQALKLLLEFLK